MVNSKIKLYAQTYDVSLLQQVLESSDIDELLASLQAMLSSRDYLQITNSNLFIRDAINFNLPRSIEFRSYLLKSTVIHSIYANAFIPIYFVRKNTIYTIGKIGDQNGISILEQVFQRSLDLDPLLIKDVLDELIWLRNSNFNIQMINTIIEKMVVHPSSFTRWATLSTPFFNKTVLLPKQEETELANLQTRFLSFMANDRFSFLRTEARSKLAQVTLNKAKNSNTDALTFDVLRIRFTNMLVSAGKLDYTIKDLEEFVDNLPESRSSDK